MAFLNLSEKNNTTPLTPTEWNYLVDKINAIRLKDVTDIESNDPAAGDMLRHNGSGWFLYNILSEFYTKDDINQMILTGGGPITINNPTTLLECNVYHQNNVTFKNLGGDYFGSSAAPRIGTITFDGTGAVTGGVSVVYYNNATFDFPETIFTIGTFVPNELNKIYLERDADGLVTCNIVSGYGVAPPVDPGTVIAPPTNLVLTQGDFTPGGTIAAPTNLVLTEGII